MHHFSMTQTFKPGMLPKDTYNFRSFHVNGLQRKTVVSLKHHPKDVKMCKKIHTRRSRRFLNKLAEEY